MNWLFRSIRGPNGIILRKVIWMGSNVSYNENTRWR